MISSALFSSRSEEWATPQALFDQLNAEFHFTLDPCARQDNAKCARFFTKDQDGLRQKWGGAVFVNPPYGRKIGLWVEKAFLESQTNADVVVMLIPARTDTGYFHEFIYGKGEIRFIRGRVRFGDGKNSAPFPSMIVVFRKEALNGKVSS